MHKWEQKQKQKMHELKIENAKSSIQTYSNSKDKKSIHTNNSNHLNSNDIAAPISRILQIFEFEKYGPLLQNNGFPARLAQEDYLKDVNKMLREVEEQDKEKFLSLINILKNMSKDMEKQAKTPKSMAKSVSQPRKIFYPPSQYSKLAKKFSQKSEKTSIKLNSKQQNIAINNKIEGGSELMISSPSENIKPTSSNTFENEIERKRSTTCFNSRATDDLFLVYDFPLIENYEEEGTLRTIKDSNKLLNRLLEKLETLDESVSKIESTDVKLEIDKIKNMYLSFDSATLTSNIINIDLDQMIQCLAIEVNQMIVEGEVENLALSNADKILSLLHESFVLVREESKRSQNLEADEYLEEKCFEEESNESMENESIELKCIKNSSKKESKELKGSLDYLDFSLDQSKYFESPNPIQKFQFMREINFNEQSDIKIEDQFDTDKSSEELNELDENTSIDLNHQMKESSIWGNSYIASVINDFTCFDNVFGSSAFEELPQYEDVKNFIEWVVHSGNMEKEVPILAYVYLKRLLNSCTVKNGKLTQKNWKNLMLVTLIEASKIWDDQSLENHSFAELIHPYTTLEINRLEKYLLYFLDYHLTIGQAEYSEAYFKLRKHTGQHDCAANKDQLHFDLKTIKKLQESEFYGSGKDSKKKTVEKKEYLKRLLNKSF